MATRFAYVLRRVDTGHFMSGEGGTTPYRDKARVFASVEEAVRVQNALPQEGWEIERVRVHVGASGRVLDVEAWEG